jgi:CRP-like cAMP-binding protein
MNFDAAPVALPTLAPTVIAHPLFHSLKVDAVSAALERIALVEFERNQFVFHAGDSAHHVYLLFEGLVKISYLNRGGDEKIISIFQAGDVFGELFLGKYPQRIGTARTITPVLVGRISRDGLLDAIARIPQLGLNLIGHLADEQRETLARLHALMHIDARHRLLGTLLSLARRAGHREGNWIELAAGITQDDLASIACLNRSTVSTHVNDLRAQGVLGGRGRIILINREAVEALLHDAGMEILE